MAGGEVAAMAIIEAAARLVPGVLGNRESPQVESFSVANRGLLEFPQFTRPQEFRGLEVPEVLRRGHHAEVNRWRSEQALQRTRERRPDLLVATGGTASTEAPGSSSAAPAAPRAPSEPPDSRSSGS
jgi:tRNA (guanine37-N1)-methyltransferase